MRKLSEFQCSFGTILLESDLRHCHTLPLMDFKANKALFGVLIVNDGETRHYVADYHVLVRILNLIAFLSQL